MSHGKTPAIIGSVLGVHRREVKIRKGGKKEGIRREKRVEESTGRVEGTKDGEKEGKREGTKDRRKKGRTIDKGEK